MSRVQSVSAPFKWYKALLLVVLLCIIGQLGGLFTGVSRAAAKEYAVDKVHIAAQILDDGDLEVTENRVFTFKGDFSALWWEFGKLPKDSQPQINGVELYWLDKSGIKTSQQIEPAVFLPQWRQSGGPVNPSYSYDANEQTIYVFAPFHNRKVEVSFKYRLTNFVQVWADAAELYWKFIGPGWKVPSQNVHVNLAVPVPATQSVKPGENIKAWAHGPLDGLVTFSGNHIELKVPEVKARNFAELRVVMDPKWLSAVHPGSPNYHAENHRALIEQEEKDLAQQANMWRLAAALLLWGSLLIGVLLVGWALVVFWRYGREIKPNFQEKYWRDDPCAHLEITGAVPSGQKVDLHPTTVGYLLNGRIFTGQEFTVTLMECARKKILRIDPMPVASKKDKDFNLKITRLDGGDTITEIDPIDAAALQLVFEVGAAGKPEITWQELKTCMRKEPAKMSQAYSEWKSAIRAGACAHTWIDPKSASYRDLMGILLLFVFIAGLVPLMFWGIYSQLFGAGLAVIGLGTIWLFMHRMTRFGLEITARANALRNWLKDFSNLKEAPVTDVKIWGKLMVYAVILGVSREAVKGLETHAPFIVEQEEFAPIWLWVSPYMWTGYGMRHSNLANNFSNNWSYAAGSLSLPVSGGTSSNPFGAGGGFSVGGGGGFGGGGGGAR